MSISPSDVIALAAFLLSAIATWKTVQFNSRQKTLIAGQEKLNELLLAKGQAEAEDDKKADLGATFVKLGSSSYRLKIWNKGKASARGVMVEFPEGNDVVPHREITEKFPLEVLEPFQSVELVASVHMGTRRKHTVGLSWADDHSDRNEKTVYPTL